MMTQFRAKTIIRKRRTSNQRQNVLTNIQASPKLIKFIDEKIGRSSLFKRNFDELGLNTNRCPDYSEKTRCKFNSIGMLNLGYPYPKINGLYYYSFDSYFGDTMVIGSVLDENYYIEDINRAIHKQINTNPAKEAMLCSTASVPVYFYTNSNPYKFKIYDKFLELEIEVSGPRERTGILKSSVIAYYITDKTPSVERCIVSQQSNQKARLKGGELELH